MKKATINRIVTCIAAWKIIEPLPVYKRQPAPCPKQSVNTKRLGKPRGQVGAFGPREKRPTLRQIVLLGQTAGSTHRRAGRESHGLATFHGENRWNGNGRNAGPGTPRHRQDRPGAFSLRDRAGNRP